MRHRLNNKIIAGIAAVLGLSLLGFLPDRSLSFRAGKQVLSEWTIVLFVASFFVKNIYIKLFLIWSALRTFLGYNKYSYLTLNVIFLYSVWYQVMYDNLKKDLLPRVLNIVCFVGLAQAFMMFLQKADIWVMIEPLDGFVSRQEIVPNLISYGQTKGHRNYTGFMSNINMAGSLLAMSLPAFFREGWKRYMPIIVAGTFLSFSLGGIIPVLLILCIMAFSTSLVYGYIITACCAGIFLLYFKEYETLKNVLKGSRRLEYWKYMVKNIVPQKPIVGWGVGQFKLLFPVIHKNVFDKGTKIAVRQAHNEYLQLIIEQGFIAISIVFAGIVNYAKKAFRCKTKVQYIGALGILTALINSTVNFMFHTTVGILFFVYLICLEKGADDGFQEARTR